MLKFGNIKCISLYALLMVLLGCSSVKEINNSKNLSAQPINKLLIGWDEMILAIKNSSSNIEELKDRTFRLQLKLSGKNWFLDMNPERSFAVKKDSDNIFLVTIINPLPLFDTAGGLIKVKYIWGELSKGGGDKGYINIDADIDCLYKVSYFQGDKGQVNFKKLSESFDRKFIISHPDLLKIYYQTPNEVVFIKKKGSEDTNVKVRLELKDRRNGTLYSGREISIPKCLDSRKKLESDDNVYVLREPGQCITHLKTTGNKFDIGKESNVSFKESFGNTCHIPISCQFSAVYSYLKGRKILKTESKSYGFVVLPFSSTEVDTSWNYNSLLEDFDAKLYSANYLCQSCIPQKGSYKTTHNDFLKCKWKR